MFLIVLKPNFKILEKNMLVAASIFVIVGGSFSCFKMQNQAISQKHQLFLWIKKDQILIPSTFGLF